MVVGWLGGLPEFSCVVKGKFKNAHIFQKVAY